MRADEEQQKIIDKIVELLNVSFDQNELLLTPDKNIHVAVAVLDLLRLTVPNDIIKDGGDRYVDITYKIGGADILSRILNNERSKLDKVHSDIIYGGEDGGS